MALHSKTASLAGLTVPVFSKGVTPVEYHLTPNVSTEEEAYATAKLLTRFRMRIETARLICHASPTGPHTFDWSTDDSVLLGEQVATAVYRNKRDAIVIRQEDVGGDNDHFVILRDADAFRLLVGALQREIKGER